ADAGGVGEEQDGAPAGLPRAGGNRQGGGQEGPDAGAPGRPEGQADEQWPNGAGQPGKAGHEALLPGQRAPHGAEARRPAVAPSPAKTAAKPSTNSSVAGTARAGSRASTASPAMRPR